MSFQGSGCPIDPARRTRTPRNRRRWPLSPQSLQAARQAHARAAALVAVIEDDRVRRARIVRQLQLSGFRTTARRTLTELHRRPRDEQPDVVVLGSSDSPGVDRAAAVERWRDDEITGEIPILLSEEPTPDAGANGDLALGDELVEAIRALIDAPQPELFP